MAQYKCFRVDLDGPRYDLAEEVAAEDAANALKMFCGYAATESGVTRSGVEYATDRVEGEYDFWYPYYMAEAM